MTSDKYDWHRFIWKIENFSYCWHKKTEYISSPIFCMDGIRWSLQIFPRGRDRGDYIACYLKREVSSGRQVKFKIACLNPDSSPLSSWISCEGKRFTRHETDGSDKFVARNDVFVNEEKKYLPNDTLTVCCCIDRNKSLCNFYNVLARTRIEVYQQIITGKIKDFSCHESGIMEIYSSSFDKPILEISVSLGEGACCDDNLIIELFLENDEKRKFSTCNVFLLDTTGNKIKCGKSDIWFDKSKADQKWIFRLIFTKWDLMKDKDLYLCNDILFLLFECSSSVGIFSEKTEHIDFAALHGEPVNISGRVGDSSSLEDIGWLLRENILCDVTLQTRTKTFPAHKAILSARSPVFKTMFVNDLKVQMTNKIDVIHFDDETVRLLLMYIYTNTLDDLHFESASQLYIAADKYSVGTLKKECAYLMDQNLTHENVLKCFEQAEKHEDEYLKDFVKDFILQHDEDIIGSDEWKNLELENPQLFSKMMCHLNKKVKRL